MARRFANLLSMRLAREWALANDGALITDHDYLTACSTCSNPATTIAAVRGLLPPRDPAASAHSPGRHPVCRLIASAGRRLFVSSSPSSIRPSMPCSPCWAAAANPPC